MPCSDTFELKRLCAYLRRVVGRNGYKNHERDSLVESVLETLRKVEAERCDHTLRQRIEEKLGITGSFRRTEEYLLLQQALGSTVELHTRWIRKREQSLGDAIQHLQSADEEPCDQLAKEELRQQVRHEIDRLSPEQRSLIDRVYWDGMTNKAELARDIGKDRRRIHDEHKRAVEILKERLKPLWTLYTR
jgi:DNA-directed RNA polymerase sigma subunit (sigma70/sigma32)